MAPASCNTLAFRDPETPLARHLIATYAAAQILYSGEWAALARSIEKLLERRGLRLQESLEPVLWYAALLHDIGKASPRYSSSRSYMGHEILSAAYLYAASMGSRATLVLASLAVLLHHHGMSPERLHKAAERLENSDNLLRGDVECMNRAVGEVAAAADRLGYSGAAALLTGLEAGVMAYRRAFRTLLDALRGATTRPSDRLASLLNQLVEGHTPGSFFEHYYPLSRLVSVATGFLSVADSIAVLIDGRVRLEDARDAAERLRGNYATRVLLEKAGSPHRLIYYALRLGAESEKLTRTRSP